MWLVDSQVAPYLITSIILRCFNEQQETRNGRMGGSDANFVIIMITPVHFCPCDKQVKFHAKLCSQFLCAYFSFNQQLSEICRREIRLEITLT